MRAAVVTVHGQPPAYADHPEPSAGADLVEVRMTAAPVVPLDLLCATGTSYFGAPAVPYVPGVQGVGRLEDGTRVWVSSSAGMAPGDGTLAERCVVRSADVVPLASDADGLDDAVVAAIGQSGVAAWGALARARVQPGERVVVLGAGGAVGQAALGVARANGAGRIVGVCRPGASVERARVAGADDVVVLPDDEDAPALAAAVEAALGGAADVVVDPVFGWVATAACLALAPRGRLVNLGGSAGDAATLSSAVVRGKSLDVLGYTNNSLMPVQRAEALTGVVSLAAAGGLTVAHDVRPLAEVADAWQAVATGAAVRQVLTTA